MATSGTVGQTRIRVNDVIDAAMRRARLPSAAGTPETLDIGRRVAFTYLSSLANRGIVQWTIENTILGTVPNQIIYDLPTGTVEVRNVMARTMSRPTGTASTSAAGTADNAFDADVDTVCTQTSTNGNIGLAYTTDQVVVCVGVLTNGARTYNLIFEASEDGVTYTTVLAPGSTDYLDGIWTYRTINTPASMPYFRVRETAGGTLNVRELYFGTAPNEVTVSRMNQDDYTAQPFKNQSGSPSTNFFVERRFDVVRLYMWPTSNTAFNQYSIWRWRYPQDPGDLSDEFEIPSRWNQALINYVALEMAVEVGGQYGITIDWINLLGGIAEKSTKEAELEERDNSPIFWTPQIAVYTT